MSPRDLLNSYGIVVLIALLLGLITGGSPVYPAEITIIALALMMSLSLSEIELRSVPERGMLRPVSLTLVLNYVVLTGLILFIAQFFDGDLRTGWIIMAAVPSAVAIIPFSYMLNGDTKLALLGTTSIYILALLIAPVITIVAIGQGIDQMRLISIIVILIVLPLVASRLPRLRNLGRERKTPLINLCFGLLVFVMTGANRDAFGEEVSMVMWVSLASLIRTFGIGLLVLWLLRTSKMRRDRANVLVLFASYKNLGLTAAIAMALISYEAAIPPTICIPFELIWLIALKSLISEKSSDTFVENK